MGEFGAFLTAARERAGYTCEQLATKTKIPVRIIEALEAERWGDLPEPVFVRGFAQSLCRAVGADDAQAMELVSAVLRARRGAEPRPGNSRDGEPAGMREAPRGAILLGPRRSAPMTWTYLAIVIVFVVGILVALLTLGTGKGEGDLSRAGRPARVERSGHDVLPQ